MKPMRRVALFTLAIVSFAVPAALPGVSSASSLQIVSGPNPFEPTDCHAGPVANAAGARDAVREPVMAIDPANSNRRVVAFIQDLNLAIVIRYTRDGGASWQTSQVPHLSTCTGAPGELTVDPSFAYSADGSTLYLAAFNTPAANVASRIEVATSHDDGATWSKPSSPTPIPTTAVETPRVTTDPRDPRHAYVIWDARDPVDESIGQLLVSETHNFGATWSIPSPVTGQGLADPSLTPRLFVLSSGVLAVVFQTGPPTPVVSAPQEVDATVSADGGKSWSAPVKVGEFLNGFNVQQRSDATLWDNLASTLAPDGTLYAVWPMIETSGSTRLMLASSQNGLTWSAPREVASAPSQEAMCAIAADTAGNLAVTYYRYVATGSTGAPLAEVWGATSQDRGNTWTRSALTGGFDISKAFGATISDYDDIAALAPGQFSAVVELTDQYSRNGSSDIYAIDLSVPQTITVRGARGPHRASTSHTP